MSRASDQWTPEEYEFVEDHPDWTAKQVGAEIGRPPGSVYYVRKKIRAGFKHDDLVRVWTKEEDAFILATPNLTASEVGKRLDRTTTAIHSRRHKISSALGGVSFGTAQDKIPNWVGKRTLIAKTCSQCGRIRPGDLFSRTSGRPNGACKLCRPSKSGKQWPEKSPRAALASKAHLAKLQAMSMPANRHRQPWIDSDDETLRHPDLTILEKALRLGRTYAATSFRCSVNGYTSKNPHSVGEDGEWHVRKEAAA